MKTIGKLILIMVLALGVFGACTQNDYELPPVVAPQYSGAAANITIKQLKDSFKMSSATTELAMKEITQNFVLKARVTANDASGNIYKKIMIQDATGAIEIRIDQTGLKNTYVVGQVVYINLKGLSISTYGYLYQIGYPAETGGLGNIPDVLVKKHIFLDGFPQAFAKIDTLKSLQLADTLKGKLVYLKNVYFADGGKKIFAEGGSSTMRTINALGGGTIVAYNSVYASFAKDTLPSGVGDLVGILSNYRGTWQLLIRDKDDIKFKSYSEGTGTQTDPFTVTFAGNQQTGNITGWVKGYIIGAVKPGITNITSMADISRTAPFMDNTIVIAASKDENDITKCLVFELPSGSAIRAKVNLMDSVKNIGKWLKVNGTFGKYMNTKGLTVAGGGSRANFELEGMAAVPNGAGTQASPYNVQQIITATADATGKWVKGYIVGNVDKTGMSISTEATFASPFLIQTNLLMADDPDEKDYTRCIPVQLPTGALRTALNLVSNPLNLRKELLIYGDVTTYFGVKGVKNPSIFALDGNKPANPPFYTEAFTSSLGQYTGESKSGAEVWVWKSGYGATVSGYANSKSNANEDWLKSPAIDLTGKTSAILTFEHAINKGAVANLKTNHTLWMSADDGATWEQVTITTYPTGVDWTFVSSGDITIPAKFLGKNKFRIAFKYLCSDTESATWEIKNLSIRE